MRKLRILIATPIFPPAIGGPATVAENLSRTLAKLGHEVRVLAYGGEISVVAPPGASVVLVSSRLPSGVKHLWYFIKALNRLRQSDVALGFDPFIVGVPLAAACRIMAKPFYLRVEGDFLWEMYVERTGEEITLRHFNQRLAALPLNVKERIIYHLSRLVFRRAAGLVFSSEWRKAIFERGYPRVAKKVSLIFPPWPKPGHGGGGREKVIVFAGRFLKLKNLRRLILAFLAAGAAEWRLELIGGGPEKRELENLIAEHGAGRRVMIRPPLAREKLVERIASARTVLLPSLSDISPNIILDCLETGTPFLLTKETGFYESLKDIGLFVDPLDDGDIKEKMGKLLNPAAYEEYRERLRQFAKTRTWDEIADEWLRLIVNGSL